MIDSGQKSPVPDSHDTDRLLGLEDTWRDNPFTSWPKAEKHPVKDTTVSRAARPCYSCFLEGLLHIQPLSPIHLRAKANRYSFFFCCAGIFHILEGFFPIILSTRVYQISTHYLKYIFTGFASPLLLCLTFCFWSKSFLKHVNKRPISITEGTS